ncbi:hypothetical protein [Pseudorhodoferax sp.]|uniref:hypothetical protein n=1 Tax=Pseudorhodoferax sp. TaxID=1993553 RepID=UPI0039E4288F
MAEINARGAAEIAAGRKVLFDSDGKSGTAVVEMPAVHAAANGDTAGSGIVLPKGTRFLCPVTVSCAAGTASATLSVGLRNPRTKAAIDAAALVSAASISAAATAQVNTGTKLIGGQRYVLDQDAEIYLTFGGATPPANQAVRVEVGYIAA